MNYKPINTKLPLSFPVLLFTLPHFRYFMPTSTVPVVERIHVYPIKSCHSIELQECEIDNLGIKHDRRFMIIDDESNKFITQRCVLYPQLNIVSHFIHAESTHLYAFCDPSLMLKTTP